MRWGMKQLAILLLVQVRLLGPSGLDQFSEVDFLDSSIVEVQYSGQVEVLPFQNTSFIRIDVHGARGGDYNPTYGTSGQMAVWERDWKLLFAILHIIRHASSQCRRAKWLQWRRGSGLRFL